MGQVDDETESRKIIQGILKIFRYIYSSDTFFKVYQKLLCLRVLSDNFKNNDMETDMISELKVSLGLGRPKQGLGLSARSQP